jgi:hypothetical protein
MIEDFQISWREIRRLRRLAMFMSVGWIPAMCVLTLTVTHFIKSPTTLVPLFLGVFAAWIFAKWRLRFRISKWPCPQCRSPFYGSALWFRRSCPHCGLKAYALPIEDDKESAKCDPKTLNP